MRIGSQLHCFILEQSDPHPAIATARFSAANSQNVSPRHCCVYSHDGDAQAFLASLASELPNNGAVSLFQRIRNASSEASHDAFVATLPPERKHKYLGAFHEQAGNLAAAIAEYESLKQSTGHLPPWHWHAIRHLCRCNLAIGQLDTCAELLVDAYLDEPNLLLGIDPAEVVAAYQQRPGHEQRADLSWILLYYLVHHDEAAPYRIRLLFVMSQRYLISKGVERPSEITPPTDLRSLKRHVYFLRHVCSLAVLDSSLAFPTAQSLEEERIRICQLLAELDSIHLSEHTSEIARIIEARAVAHAIQRVDKGKIYVDTVGLMKSLEKGLRERFDRYVQLRAMNEELRKIIRAADITRDRDFVFVILDAAYESFKQLFTDIRTRYVSSSEYGLDSYLSVRIRHGTLSGQIRSRFESLHLITRKAGPQGIYAANTYWHEQLMHFGDDAVSEVDDCFRAFSARVDGIIALIKDSWVQIKNDTDKREGLFDYGFSDKEYILLYSSVSSTTEFGVFAKSILGHLQARTEENLECIRAVITKDLHDKLATAINDLESGIQKIMPAIRGTALSAAVVTCRTNIQTEIETIAGWFRFADETSVPEYDFKLAVDTSLTIASRIYPSRKLTAQTTVSCAHKFVGGSLRPFIDLLLNLLANVVKHGNPDDSFVFISVACESDTLEINVRNGLPSGTDVQRLRGQIKALDDRLSQSGDSGDVRSEGGTGFAKMKKILMYDLGCEEPRISCQVIDESSFAVTILVRITGVKYERSHN